MREWIAMKLEDFADMLLTAAWFIKPTYYNDTEVDL